MRVLVANVLALVLLLSMGCQGPRAFDTVELEDDRELRREARLLWSAGDWPGLNPDAARLVVLDVEVDLSDRADDGRIVRWPFDAEEILREHFREALAESLAEHAMVDVERSPDADQPVLTGDDPLLLGVPRDVPGVGNESPEAGTRTRWPSEAGAVGFDVTTGWDADQIAVLCRQLDADAAVRVRLRVKLDRMGRLVVRPSSTFDVAAGFYSDPLRPEAPILPRREGELTFRGGLRTVEPVGAKQPAWLDTIEPSFGDDEADSRWITDTDELNDEAPELFKPFTTTVVYRLKG